MANMTIRNLDDDIKQRLRIPSGRARSLDGGGSTGDLASGTHRDCVPHQSGTRHTRSIRALGSVLNWTYRRASRCASHLGSVKVR